MVEDRHAADSVIAPRPARGLDGKDDFAERRLGGQRALVGEIGCRVGVKFRQFVAPPADQLRRLDADQRLEVGGKIGEAQIGIHLPEPVGACLDQGLQPGFPRAAGERVRLAGYGVRMLSHGRGAVSFIEVEKS